MLPNAVYTVAAFLLAGGFVLLYSMKNKRIKRWIILSLVCVAVAFVLIDFGPKQSKRPFRQPTENIVSVAVRTEQSYNPQSGEVEASLKELSADDGVSLICALQKLELDYIYFNAFLDPSSIMLEIRYKDGEVEQLDPHNNFWITSDGKVRSGGYQFADIKKALRILDQYE